MRRIRPFLKYIPPVLFALLVAAWIGSFYLALVVQVPLGKGRGILYVENACLAINYRSAPSDWIIQFADDNNGWNLTTQKPSRLWSRSAIWGSCNWHSESAASISNAKSFRLQLAIPLLILLAFPFAVVPLTGFRFPLWSWFAWTTAIAVVLGFYLR